MAAAGEAAARCGDPTAAASRSRLRRASRSATSGDRCSSRATTAVILNETRSGWVWTVPGRRAVPSSQNWTLDDRTEPEAVPSEEQLRVVLDPKPPVAEPDAFGVRPGSLVDASGAAERPRPERGRAEHRPGIGRRAWTPASAPCRSPTTVSGSRCASLPAPRARDLLVRGDRRHGRRMGCRPRPRRSRCTVARRSRNSAPQWCGVERLPASGRPPRSPAAAPSPFRAPGLGRPRGRPAAPPLRRERVGRRQRGRDPRRRRRLPAQRRRRRRRAARSSSTVTVADTDGATRTKPLAGARLAASRSSPCSPSPWSTPSTPASPSMSRPT